MRSDGQRVHTLRIHPTIEIHRGDEYHVQKNLRPLIDHRRCLDRELTTYMLDMFSSRFDDIVTVHGPRSADDRLGVVSFSVRDIHPHDVSQLLDEYGVCVRAGHHCAKPLMRELVANGTKGIGSASRASLYLYNNTDDIDALGNALDKALAFFSVR